MVPLAPPAHKGHKATSERPVRRVPKDRRALSVRPEQSALPGLTVRPGLPELPERLELPERPERPERLELRDLLGPLEVVE